MVSYISATGAKVKTTEFTVFHQRTGNKKESGELFFFCLIAQAAFGFESCIWTIQTLPIEH